MSIGELDRKTLEGSSYTDGAKFLGASYFGVRERGFGADSSPPFGGSSKVQLIEGSA